LCSIREALLEAAVVEAISTSTIGRILHRAGLKPHRYRMWVHSHRRTNPPPPPGP
jgi:hypothetical protein